VAFPPCCKVFIAAVIVGTPVASAFAAEPPKWWAKEKGITAGKLIQGSTSPDGKYALFEFNHWDADVPESETTATGIGLGPVDRSKLLFAVDVATRWTTDQDVTSFSNLLWNSSSTILATHDSLPRNSAVHLYRLHDGSASSMDLPDLLALACQKLGIAKSAVAASGQLPSRWIDGQTLEVAVRINAKKRKLTTSLLLHVGSDGTASIR
jgi:hypothetical protein